VSSVFIKKNQLTLDGSVRRRYGLEAEHALMLLKQHLPKTACLVGQNIGKDVQWLGLKEGVDFTSLVDLAGLFRVYNPKYRGYTYFGLDHVATVLLGEFETNQRRASVSTCFT